MKIREVNDNKKQFVSLLLLADEQKNMVERYLEKGTMRVAILFYRLEQVIVRLRYHFMKNAVLSVLT